MTYVLHSVHDLLGMVISMGWNRGLRATQRVC